MRFSTRSMVLLLAGCMVQNVSGVATVHAQQPETTDEQTGAATAKSGIADGKASPALTEARRPLYRLCKSDVLDISFTFSPEFNQTVTVQPDGYVSLKAVAQVYAEGITVPDLGALIREAYTGVLRDPEVSATLKDFDKPFFIAGGEVGRPGKYELRSDATVTEAVAMAGGFTPRAKHSQVVLFRRVSDEVVESHLLNIKSMLNSRQLQEDMHLRSGDLIFVPQNLISKIRQFMPSSNLSLYSTPTQF
ncbi:MAG TPA: polysaccharide biosynthesis/export family protein [Terriglobales bacterium]|jgi:polysaccharide export outer membrane protein|nr:polysaccharide biosynthesis/export family protein [Terriglobales bacterium]